MQKLIFAAGRRALRRIRDQGLSPADIQVVAGAAGGPKWLILGHLDRLLFGSWLKGRQGPLHLLGSSIGSWRFAAASCADPVAAIDRMEQAYIHQRYADTPTPRQISTTMAAIIDQTLGADGAGRVLSHATHRLHLLAARSRHLLASEHRLPLALGLLAAVAANLASRSLLTGFFRQTLFSDPRNHPPFDALATPPNASAPLCADNLKAALLASGSIPYLMAGVPAIAHAPKGVYRDGGVMDYHLDVPFGLNGRGIVLFPHFGPRIIPGWFDKHLNWRKPAADNLADVLLVAPHPDFVAGLPDGKITDRKDFYRYKGDDAGRFAAWQQVADAGQYLADEFFEVMESGSIGQRVQPL